MAKYLIVFLFFFGLADMATAYRTDTALLQVLDKITGRISTLSAPIEQPVDFGTLEITALTCEKTRPEETPEQAAFLEISESRKDIKNEAVFRGWMFASSPAISSLEHPVYDVWVIDCINQSSGSGS